MCTSPAYEGHWLCEASLRGYFHRNILHLPTPQISDMFPACAINNSDLKELECTSFQGSSSRISAFFLVIFDMFRSGLYVRISL